jgi:phenylpropionate dioxygenase-like ring-hydroxylating dioxygenase large terminal subunit
MLNRDRLARLWHVVARSTDVREDGLVAARLLGEDLVLWRSNGEIQAWRDRCIHRGVKLSLGRLHDGCVVCPYHGWRYGADGRCVHIPAHADQEPPTRARAVVYRAVERYGFVWVALVEPEADPAPFPEWDDSDFRKVHAGPYRFRADAFRAVENFLDVTHLAILHAGILGRPEDAAHLADYDVEIDADGVRSGAIKVSQPFGDQRGVPVESIYRYRCPRPLSPYFLKDTGDGRRFSTFMTATPVDADDTLLWLCLAINFGRDLPEEEIVNRQNLIFGQDKAIVESQCPRALPMSLHEELHVRSDKLTVAYRRWLGQLGFVDG